MPDDLKTTREALKENREKLEEVEGRVTEELENYRADMARRDENLHRRNRLFVKVALGLTAAIVGLAVAILVLALTIRADHQDRLESCRSGRRDLQAEGVATADVIVKLAKASRNNQDPETQARLEAARPIVQDELRSAAPSPDGCR